jgi:hypothetical protein
MYMIQLYHKIERFIDRVKVTSRGYDVMGLETYRPADRVTSRYGTSLN